MATGPSGFTDRYKGKIACPIGGVYVGGIQVNASGPDMNTGVGWGTAPTSTLSTATITMSSGRAAGIDIFNPASGGSPIFQLPSPFAGANKVLDYSTLNGSTQILWTCSTVTGVTIQGTYSTAIGGSSLTRVIKSTISCTVELLGLSSLQWSFNSVYPSTTGHLTFSTTT
jgi:hypothetical protein